MTHDIEKKADFEKLQMLESEVPYKKHLQKKLGQDRKVFPLPTPLP